MGEKAELQKIQDVFDIVHGRKKADLLLKNLNILDVSGDSIYKGSILLYDKRIVALSPDEMDIDVKLTFDGMGLYAIPGLIDVYFNYRENVEYLPMPADEMVANGITTVFMESNNKDCMAKTGKKGEITYLAQLETILPYRLFSFASGGSSEDGFVYCSHSSLTGQYKNFSHITDEKSQCRGYPSSEEYRSHLSVVEIPKNNSSNSKDSKRLCNQGNCNEITSVYGYCGSKDCSRLNFKNGFTLSKDCVSISRFLALGQSESITSLCLTMGITPINAIKTATYKAACHFSMDSHIGSLAPGCYGDIILSDSLAKVNPVYVFKDGEIISENKRLTKIFNSDYTLLSKKDTLTGLSMAGSILKQTS